MTLEPDPRRWLDALAGSHDTLAARVGNLSPGDLGRRSYCDDWSVAQVLSHLGSGAEIFQAYLDAAVAGEPAPNGESFPPIWERWNAMAPAAQAEGFVTVDGQLVESLESLGDRLDELHFAMFGFMEVDAAGYLGLRLGEHGVHAWDVAVTFDPAATVADDAAALLVDRVPSLAGRLGKTEQAAGAGPFAVTVRTTGPERTFAVAVGDEIEVTETDGAPDGGATDGAGAHVELPAESLVRLVYGRLDPAHTPPLGGDPEALERLRAVFPGL